MSSRMQFAYIIASCFMASVALIMLLSFGTSHISRLPRCCHLRIKSLKIIEALLTRHCTGRGVMSGYFLLPLSFLTLSHVSPPPPGRAGEFFVMTRDR